jgi:hypothetical protein
VHAAVAHMRCHLAFARARGRAGMPECPLYLGGVRAEPMAGSQIVDLLVTDPGDLELLRLRTHRLLEK